MRYPVLIASVIWLVLPTTSPAQQLYKCIDSSGRTTYSDKACVRAPVAPSNTVAQIKPFNQAVNGKLNEALVGRILLQYLNLSDRNDYQAMCDLTAKDVTFSFNDTTKLPAKVVTGGRNKMCTMQKESAIKIEESGITMHAKMGKSQIAMNADNTQATAKYRSTTSFSLEGEELVTRECEHEKTLRVYGELVLFSNVVSNCKTSS